MNPTGTWPTPGDPSDPWADEPPDRTGFVDYRNAGGTLEEPAYLELRDRFRAALADARGGRPVATPLPALATELRLDLAATMERGKRLPAHPSVPSHEKLARVATDLCPASAGEALDRYLGPLADELDLRNPGHRTAAQNALAAFCFSRPDGAARSDGTSSTFGRSPFQTWCNRKPLPSVEDRAELRHVARTPMALWSLETTDGDRWTLADRTGLAAHVLPTGPVRLLDPACPWRSPRQGDTLVARVLEGPEGWVALCGFVVPTAPPKRRIRSWVTLALWEARLLDRRITVEHLLRTQSETLCRRLLEWAWLHGDDDPYADPALYDLEYAGHDEDVTHYVALARQFGGPVLELGCGTGRLTLELARAGVDVDGIDLSQPMLDRLNDRLKSEPALDLRIRTWAADFRDLETDRRYPLVVWPFNAMHHTRSLDQIRQTLGRIEAALQPGGTLALDCYLPALELYDRDPAERVEPRTFAHPETGEALESWEQGWWDPVLRIHHVLYVYRRESGRTHTTHLQLRMYELDELRTCLQQAGWRIVSEAQDFQGTPVGEHALKWVVVATR